MKPGVNLAPFGMCSSPINPTSPQRQRRPSACSPPSRAFPRRQAVDTRVEECRHSQRRPSDVVRRVPVRLPREQFVLIEDRAEHWGVTVSPAKKTLTRGLFDRAPFDVLMKLTPNEGASLVATGQADPVAGAPCHVYRVREAHGDEYECCVVSTPFAADGARGDAGETPPWGGLFSLRTVVRDDAGAETNRIEVTKIEEKPLDPSLFLLPAGHRKVAPEGLQR